jgi:ABC-type amino acid transport substrate-binding protein
MIFNYKSAFIWKQYKLKRLLFLLILIPVLPVSAFHNIYASEVNGKTVISAIENEQTHAIAKEVLREAYRRIGYGVQFQFLPGQRALESANDGVLDGDVARIAGTEYEYPNLIPVPTPIFYFQGFAFTKSVTRQIDSWNDLKGLRIGIIRGIRYSTIGTKELNPFFAEDMTHLFKLLNQNRIQVAVAVLDSGKIETYKNFRNSGIHATGKPLYASPLYHFLHRRNEYLIKPLNDILKCMTKQREIDLIFSKEFQKYFNE